MSDVGYLIFGAILTISLPRLMLAILFFAKGGWIFGALGVLACIYCKDDHKAFAHAMDGFKAAGMGLWRLFTAHMITTIRAWVDIISLILRGKEIFVAEVVEIEKEVVKEVALRVIRVKAMEEDDALECLGFGRGDDPAIHEIEEAYRRVMKRVHPDVGGTVFLARTLNEARGILLG